MKILCVFGEHGYGDPARGLSYEFANFIPALKNLGHEVAFFESWDKSLYLDYADLNLGLLKAVREEKPDVIFCVLVNYELWLETLELIRSATDAVLVNWSTDDSWKYDQFSRLISSAFHLYVTTYRSAMLKAAKHHLDNFILSQWAAGSDAIAEPLTAEKCEHDVSFIGSAYGNRVRWVEMLKERGINVDCYGYGWPGGSISVADMHKIMRESVISLNFADSGVILRGLAFTRSRQIKARIFEVPGAGGFLMTEAAGCIENYYKQGEEIIEFKDPEDLEAKIRYFLNHPEKRDAICQAGHTRTVCDHTYEKRFSVLLAEAMARKKATVAGGQQVEGDIDFERFAEIAAKHRMTTGLRIFRWIFLQPFRLLWKRERVVRVARRVLFEFSWRLCGRKTYSAVGLPGRLFYSDSR